MRLVENSGLRYLRFPMLDRVPGIRHGVFARYSLNGDGSKISLNLGLHGLDADEQVWKNRRRVMAAAGVQIGIFARQVHGVEVAVWDETASDARVDGVDNVRLSGDALITNVPGAALVIQTADCQSVLLVDPVRRVVANIHSGWRGSIGNVIGRTVKTMHDRFGCNAADLHCAVGPSLGPCCAEFIHYQQEIPEQFWQYRGRDDLFDFWRLSVDQLADCGVPKHQVAVSGICTRCNQQLFFSYRGEGQKAGRFAALISLSE